MQGIVLSSKMRWCAYFAEQSVVVYMINDSILWSTPKEDMSVDRDYSICNARGKLTGGPVHIPRDIFMKNVEEDIDAITRTAHILVLRNSQLHRIISRVITGDYATDMYIMNIMDGRNIVCSLATYAHSLLGTYLRRCVAREVIDTADLVEKLVEIRQMLLSLFFQKAEQKTTWILN